jgi:molybdopterin converting factor small subunit
LLVELATEFPSLENHHVDRSGEIPRELNVTVNGRNVRLLDGSETSLNEGDIVRLAPPVSGG